MGSHRRYNVAQPYTAGFSNRFQSIKDRLNIPRYFRAVTVAWHAIHALFEILVITIFWYVDSIEAKWGTYFPEKPDWFEYNISVGTFNTLSAFPVL